MCYMFDPAICEMCASCSIPIYVLKGYMSKKVAKMLNVIDDPVKITGLLKLSVSCSMLLLKMS